MVPHDPTMLFGNLCDRQRKSAGIRSEQDVDTVSFKQQAHILYRAADPALVVVVDERCTALLAPQLHTLERLAPLAGKLPGERNRKPDCEVVLITNLRSMHGSTPSVLTQAPTP